MGHSKLRHLPKKIQWQKVVEALTRSDASLTEIVSATSKASEKILTDSRNIQGLAHCFWLFTNIAEASRSGNFVQELNNIGINISEKDSGLNILKKINDFASETLASSGKYAILDHIAVDSFNTALLNTIKRDSNNLFGCSVESIQDAFKKYSTSKQISLLGRDFFSQYIYRSFSLVLEKEMANKIDKNNRFKNSGDLEEFNSRLKSYCWDVSKIVEDFSGGWYGKHSFEGDLRNKKKVLGFTQHVITKLLSEVRREAV